MRDTIRLPADVELSTKFISIGDKEVTGPTKITIESVPNGKFNKVTKLTIELPEFGVIAVITPKERRPYAGQSVQNTAVPQQDGNDRQVD